MIKYIQSIDCFNEICAYNTKTGKYSIELKDKKNIETNIGFFTRINSDVYGVVESAKGPVFFHNNKYYLLRELNYKLSHQHLMPKIGEFKLIVNGEIKEDVVYKITPYTDYDPWSLEEEVDFFQWFCGLQNNDLGKSRFIAFYTNS